MKIRLIGNYYSNNGGDDLYKYILEKEFPEHEFIGHKGAKDYDYTIYGGGGILGTRLKIIDKPYCMLSVGYNIKCDYSLYKDADFITVRDEKAYLSLKNINDNVFMLPDLAWLYKPKVDKVNNKIHTIGIMLRHCLKYTDEVIVQNTIDYLSGLSIPYKVLLFHVYGKQLKRWTMQDELIAKFKKHGIKYKQIKLHKTTNLIKHLDNYNKCDSMVCMPYHSIILSALYETHYTVPFEYNYKIESMLKGRHGVEEHIELLRKRL